MQKSFIKINLLICVLLISIGNTSAQITTEKTYKPREFKKVVIDTSEVNFYYKYSTLKEKKEDKALETGYTTLLIGDKFIKFTDYYTAEMDSLEENLSLKKAIKLEELEDGVTILSKMKFKMTLVKDKLKDNALFQRRLRGIYEYQTKPPKLKWKLSNEKKLIANYKVHKATAEYGGRKWTAWYCPKLPLPYGPYIFGGLPGLIIEVYDQDRNFHFVVEGNDNRNREIYIRNEDYIVRTTKRNYLKYERAYHNRPDLFTNPNVKEVNTPNKGIPYNPIELSGD
ncbi:GLPGLI family protein [Salinimicrobium sp. CAU 1759]